ncbi:MAG: 2-methylaconitate cis-trans isomerase PrpF family protein [Geminicoccaceae bacterium]
MPARRAGELRIPAVFMRGGTSKALMFQRRDLPERQEDWPALFLAALGSPDPQGRQLDGMGGGLSSLSKICVVGPPTRPDADVDYTFAQVGIRDAEVDFAGTCGNMTAAIGPFAVDEGLVRAAGSGSACVRIHNTNTGKLIAAHFPTVDGMAAIEGEFVLDGVEGPAAPIRLDFLDPGGGKTGRLLPTGRTVDLLEAGEGDKVRATLLDVGNPCAIVAASELGLTGTEMPEALEARPDLLARLERLRRHASIVMGIAADLDAAAATVSIPKIAIVAAPQPCSALSGRRLGEEEMDLTVRMISVGQPHRALPVTGALALGVACRLPGSMAHALCRERPGQVRLGHPSGIITVDAEVVEGKAGHEAVRASLYRTARRLFQGEVLVPAGRVQQLRERA